MKTELFFLNYIEIKLTCMPSFIGIPEILTSGGPLGQSGLNGVPRDREEFRS